MVRTLLPFLLVVLPTLLYVAYSLWRQWVAASTGRPVPPPWWQTAPWPWLVAIGVLLVAAMLVTWTMIGGVPGGGSYQPPQMTPEGRVEPGDFAIPE